MTGFVNLSHNLLLLTLVITVLGCAYSCYQLLYKDSAADSRIIEHVNTFITAIYVFVSLVLLYAFYTYDFSLKYVHDYSDRSLPLFYRLTAFWGGQAGSLLFWALSVVLCSFIFQSTSSYKKLSGETRCWYLLFYFISIAFFSLLLTTHNDPFILLNPAPLIGRGLNPLLQHPGMIFHPPLLLLGYGGFTIPACLALAQAMSVNTTDLSREIPWYKCTMEIMLTAWLLLSAGIILGAWWAYMELGWGGYWAWDPVENASLVPWFFATATIHVGLLNTFRNKASRLHTLLMGITYVSAFFATWLVRGNVVASVHAFGGVGVGSTIGIYVIFSAIAVFGICALMPRNENELKGLETREGLTLSTSILLITVSIIIMIATLWPVITIIPNKIMGNEFEGSMGLGPVFYNNVILPLLTFIIALLVICPWVSWNGGIRNKKYIGAVALVFAVSMIIGWTLFKIQIPLSILAMSVSIACVCSWLLYVYEQKFNKLSPAFVHIGLALMGLGVAISGPYQIERNLIFKIGDTQHIDGFDVKLNQFYQIHVYKNAELLITKNNKSDTLNVGYQQPLTIGDYVIEIKDIIDNRTNNHDRDVDLSVTKKGEVPTITKLIQFKPQQIGDFTVEVKQKNLNRYSFQEAELFVSKDGKKIGTLLPQIRKYSTHPNEYREAVTIPSLGKEIYATLSIIDSQNRGRIRILVQPLVNWIWIGGIILSVAPFLTLFGLSNRRTRRKEEEL